MEVVCNDGLKYDKAKEVKEFDDTKAGVKGLVDSGVTKIPRFFIHPLENLPKSSDNDDICLQVPLIDLEGFEDCRRMEIVNKIREASETWGFFQLINHGVPVSVMDEMLEGVRRFHEQPKEVKMEMYSRDCQKLVRFFSNGDLLVTKGAADWRDAIAFDFRDGQLDPETFPKICSMESMETESLVCQFYPPCSEPELTFGASKHSDPSFLTVLLQDHIGGLQVLHRNYWADVPFFFSPFMWLITNDRFRSVEHRVLVGRVGPRVSVACFFYPSTMNKVKPYEPIKEFLFDDPPIYRATSVAEYMAYF